MHGDHTTDNLPHQVPTQLLLIEKDQYDKACAKHHHEKGLQRVAFLKQVFLFEDHSDDELLSLAKLFTERRYTRGGC